MYANNLEQLINFLYFIATGIILSIIFDIFRILRRTIKTSDIITNIEDIIFSLITGVLILLSIFIFNNGELRLYIFIGIIIGIIIYMTFISKYFIKFNVYIINSIKRFIEVLFRPFKILFKIIRKIFIRPISFIVINIKSFIYKFYSKIKNLTKKLKKSSTQEGF